MQPIKVVNFGRSSRNDVVLNDTKASRVHCQIIQYDNGTFVISDHGSTNGTYVNGRRVVGTMLLNWSDQVVVGNTTIQWQYYFNGSGGTTGTGDKQKSSALPLVLGIVGGVIGVVAIVLVILLLTRGHGNTHHPPREYHIGGVSLDFNMSQDDLFNENPNANIVAKHAPSGALPAHDYYVINNNMAVTFEQTNNVQESYVNQIVVWDPTFVINNIHVGDPCSRVMNEYNIDKSSNNTGTLSFWYVSSWYDYRSESFTGAICVYDASTCTGYLLFKNEFSASLWQGVTAAAGHVTSTGEFSFAALSASTYQSIYSSVTVSQIVKYNCNKGPAASPFTPRGSVEPKPSPKPTAEPVRPSSRTFSTKLNDDRRSFTLSDGSKGSFEVWTFGLGDLHVEIFWTGETPVDINWYLDSYGIAPQEGHCSCKEYGTHSYIIDESFSDFNWTASNANVNGIKIEVCPR